MEAAREMCRQVRVGLQMCWERRQRRLSMGSPVSPQRWQAKSHVGSQLCQHLAAGTEGREALLLRRYRKVRSRVVSVMVVLVPAPPVLFLVLPSVLSPKTPVQRSECPLMSVENSRYRRRITTNKQVTNVCQGENSQDEESH